MRRIHLTACILLYALCLLGCGRSGGAGAAYAPRIPVRPVAAKMHAPGHISILKQPEAGTAPIVSAIDGAAHSVWLQIYMLTDAEVIEALRRAAARGIDVRVLLEESPYNPGNPGGALSGNKAVAANLQESGVEVAWTNPSFTLTHAKTMLVDGETAYVLTYNLTRAATETNREFAVINRSQSDVAELRRIFIADWNRQSYLPTDPDLVVSPTNARWRILGLMNQAQRELLVGVEVISDPEVVATLIEKRRAGVDVRVLVGGVKKVPANLPAARTLIANGVPTRSQSKPYLHAKYIVADGQTAYVGSINFSTNSLDLNRELGMMLDDSGAIATLREVWQQDWLQAREPDADSPDAVGRRQDSVRAPSGR
ncbi:MAG: phosphatidylserine/phosphatidylglycerophosphate/cardiolipin synthase family protein [Candidatus Sericytochromatia bacterium]|nr:phosphatidylserine/phosphatidylglycerophosphate/cardiolipin synthase family protein [Candidatus Sericytochromatia bacterium]